MASANLIPWADIFSDGLLLPRQKPHGHSVRKRMLKKGDGFDPPNRLFLIYISMKTGKLEVRYVTVENVKFDRIDEFEADAFQTAANGGGTLSGFRAMEFSYPTVFTVVLDQDEWDFYYPKPEDENPPWPEMHDPIVFLEKKVVIYDVDGKWVRIELPTHKLGNTSFYDSSSITIANRKALRCINFLTDENGDKLKKKTDIREFSFNMFLRVPVSLTGTDRRKITIIIDPDGQNQGPDTV